ncbi:MAG: cell division protein FtsA [Thermodesulfovibrionales bacterium]|nr:cell division protein FtsA [Thermodesulfovibrionales bacterium]
MGSENYIVGLDIGTTKVCAIVGRSAGHSVEIVAYGVSPCSGLRKGVVVDMDVTVESIKKAVEEAEASSGLSIKAAYVGIAGSHIKCFDSYGATGIKGKEVTKGDLAKVIDSASSVYVPLDRDVLHILPSDFIIDGQDGIVQPVGMSGVRLEAKVNIVTASHSVVENLLKCCERAGVRAIDVVLEPVATSRAVLNDDELDSGVALVDIGGGTTDIAVYKHGRLRDTSIIAIGGSHLTNDIAIGLRLSQKEAERVKKTYGCALADSVGAAEEMDVAGINGEEKKIPRRYIAEIVGPRCEELFGLIRSELKDHLLYCAVLTGGTSLLTGIDRLAEAALGLPVRTGTPQRGSLSAGTVYESLRSPVYSTCVGLMLYGLDSEYESCIHEDVMDRVSRWFKNWRMPRIKQPFKQSIRVLTDKI